MPGRGWNRLPDEISPIRIFVLPSESCSLLKCSGALRNSLRLCARSGANSGGFCWHRIRPELLPEVIPILTGSELRTRTCSLRSFFQRLEATLLPEATPRSLESFQTKNQICLGGETEHLIFHVTILKRKQNYIVCFVGSLAPGW